MLRIKKLFPKDLSQSVLISWTCYDRWVCPVLRGFIPFNFIPGDLTEEYVIDFGLLTIVSRIKFEEAVSADKIRREVSLTTIGYFLFITKLTIFFMRPEDSEAYRSRESQ